MKNNFKKGLKKIVEATCLAIALLALIRQYKLQLNANVLHPYLNRDADYVLALIVTIRLIQMVCRRGILSAHYCDRGSKFLESLFLVRGALFSIALTGEYSSSILMTLRRVLLDTYQVFDFLPKHLVYAMVILFNIIIGFALGKIKTGKVKTKTRTKEGGESGVCI